MGGRALQQATSSGSIAPTEPIPDTEREEAEDRSPPTELVAVIPVEGGRVVPSELVRLVGLAATVATAALALPQHGIALRSEPVAVPEEPTAQHGGDANHGALRGRAA